MPAVDLEAAWPSRNDMVAAVSCRWSGMGAHFAWKVIRGLMKDSQVYADIGNQRTGQLHAGGNTRSGEGIAEPVNCRILTNKKREGLDSLAQQSCPQL